MYFDAVEAGAPGILGAVAVLLDNAGDLAGVECARLEYIHHAGVGVDKRLGALGPDRRGGDRQGTVRL